MFYFKRSEIIRKNDFINRKAILTGLEFVEPVTGFLKKPGLFETDNGEKIKIDRGSSIVFKMTKKEIIQELGSEFGNEDWTEENLHKNFKKFFIDEYTWAKQNVAVWQDYTDGKISKDEMDVSTIKYTLSQQIILACKMHESEIEAIRKEFNIKLSEE